MKPNYNLIEELRWRGMVHDIIPGTEEYLSENSVSGYVGFDPTATSLHIGSLATVMLLVHLQRAGHTPIALVGGATGMVGDPSGKSSERPMLSLEALEANVRGVENQLKKFLSFEGENAAQIVNNHDWFAPISFLDFLRDVGKHITINYMMAKDSVKKRLETGISYTEFSYQLLQGYDFFHLYKTKGVRLQMGGSDQWGNLTTGTELIRRLSGEESHAFAVTTKLLTKADGSKFGKSEEGNIWLDPKMTSPYKFYQFLLNTTDEDVSRLIRVFTLKTQEEILALEAAQAEAPHLRAMQKALAEDLTIRVHGEDELKKAQDASALLFGSGTTEALEAVDEELLLQIFEGVPKAHISKDKLESDVVSLLSVETAGSIFSSKGEARKMIEAGGVSINLLKVGLNQKGTDFNLLNNKYLLARKGKKNFYLIIVEG